MQVKSSSCKSVQRVKIISVQGLCTAMLESPVLGFCHLKHVTLILLNSFKTSNSVTYGPSS